MQFPRRTSSPRAHEAKSAIELGSTEVDDAAGFTVVDPKIRSQQLLTTLRDGTITVAFLTDPTTRPSDDGGPNRSANP